MEERKAVEIYDYIESCKEETTEDMAKALKLTIEKTRELVYLFNRKSRGEFIYHIVKNQ